MSTKLYTAELDNRGAVGSIGSRLGISRSALTFSPQTMFDYRIIESDTACIFIDEAQFLTRDQVYQLHRLVHSSKVPVICYGLRADFLGNAFEGSAALLVLCDDIEEMKTICACSKKATMNARIDENGRRVQEGAQVLIGGNDRYISMCPSCFYKPVAPATKTIVEISEKSMA
jgi:thymidine kinase